MGFTQQNLGNARRATGVSEEALVAGAADQGGGELSEEVQATLKRMGRRAANESKRKEKLREKVEEAVKEVLRAADARSRELSARSGMGSMTVTDSMTQAMRAMAETMGILADEVLGKRWALEDPPEPK
jgi:division protein CdvB (Snf7/Vps24/ESCRT-III family)